MSDIEDLNPPMQVVDPQVDPETANAMVQQVTEQKTPKPSIEAVDTLVELPGGFVDYEGKVHTTAEVKELTGYDEEKLAQPANTKSLARQVSVVLECGTVKIGEHEATPDILKEIFIGDREMLLMGIRQATYGDEIDLDVTCPQCANEMEVGYSLSKDVPIKKLDDPSQREYEVKLRRGTAMVALPTGADHEAVFENNAKLTRAEQNTMMIARCIRSVNGVSAIGNDVAKAMGAADRRKILEFIGDKQPGPQWEEVTQGCDKCGNEFPLVLTLADLFRW